MAGRDLGRGNPAQAISRHVNFTFFCNIHPSITKAKSSRHTGYCSPTWPEYWRLDLRFTWGKWTASGASADALPRQESPNDKGQHQAAGVLKVVEERHPQPYFPTQEAADRQAPKLVFNVAVADRYVHIHEPSEAQCKLSEKRNCGICERDSGGKRIDSNGQKFQPVCEQR